MSDEMMMDQMLTCDDVMRQLWDYLDVELTPDRMAAVAAHLSVCTRCYPQYDFERAFLRAVRAAQQDHRASATLRTRVQDTLRAEGLAGI